MSAIPLGKFDRVTLREAWPTEDGNFTPWLANPESLAVLGDALNMDLAIEAVEQSVGAFRADILAHLSDDESHRVIIENQFGRTDHSHLGQILTYLAGVEGTRTIVWIAETIQSDHRAAIDWLNENTSDEFSFFAIEIELWRIGDSRPAPRFNVIASPNDWTRNVRMAARHVGERALGESHQIRLAYWRSFSEYLKEKKSSFRLSTPNTDNWKWFPVGRTGFYIYDTISTEKQRISVEIYIANDTNKVAFRALCAQRQAIERDFGETLEWHELPGKKASRVSLFRSAVDPGDEKQYLDLHSWMLEKMERFRSVFADRIKALALNTSEPSYGAESDRPE